jgi:putative hydrolase of the HAD superfamily
MLLKSKLPSVLFFDLDHTLWDMDANARYALDFLFNQYDFGAIVPLSSEVFIQAYFKHNAVLWKQYESGLLEKQTLRTLRFELAMDEIGIPKKNQPQDIWEQFLKVCPLQTQLMPSAKEVLSYLYSKYTMGIITNGFSETQRLKLYHSGILPFFKHIVISEETGYKKPQKEIFWVAEKLVNNDSDSILMIGDNPETDILGAKSVGWDTVLYNPHKAETSNLADIEINHLEQLVLFL